MKLTKFPLSFLPLLLTACVSAPLYEDGTLLEKTVPEAWATSLAENSSASWLKSFNDPMMLELIAEGIANNNDVQSAAENMDKAWLLAKKSGAALKPNADLSLAGSQTNGDVSVGVTASWELDLWGRMRAGLNAANANAQAAEADYAFAQQSLSANIAKTYLKVIEAKLQAEITRKNQFVLKETMRITQVKYDNGMSSGQDVALNKANLAAANDQLISLEGSQRDAMRALEVLLGRYPDAALEIPSVLPALPLPPPSGVPSELLERRPDLVSAERKLASAFNASKQAKAAQLPRFSLTSSVSGASSSLSDALNPANMAWQLGANLMAPLFDGGRNKVDLEIANIEQKQALLNYRQKALTAFSEVETNLDQGLVLANREVALREVLEQSVKAYKIAEIRYKEGEIDLLDTLTLQKQAIAAESNSLVVQRTQLEQQINLYLSLGGNW